MFYLGVHRSRENERRSAAGLLRPLRGEDLRTAGALGSRGLGRAGRSLIRKGGEHWIMERVV